jgi:phage protein D
MKKILYLLLLLTALFVILNVAASAQGTVTPPAATPAPTATPSDLEIKKTLVRALDKIDSLNAEGKAKDEVAAGQDKALAESEIGKEEAKKEADSLRSALASETSAKFAAEQGWKADEERVKKLEKQLRNSHTKTKWAVAAGIASAVTLYLLKK